jgi:N-acetylglucosamine-6-sulfatase
MLAAAYGCGSETNPKLDENTGGHPEDRPSVLFIMADDLDAQSISQMPQLKSLLTEQGTTFENSFVTTPLCCPSRATFLRGQYSHNHGVLTNGPPLGGFEKFQNLGREKSTIASWLRSDGYRTALVGRYLNGMPPDYTPSGWDEAHINGYVGTGTYHTDWFADRSSEFIGGMEGERDPLFVYLATEAPHKPAEPAPRHADAFPDAEAPRPPSFNEEDVSDKPRYIQAKNTFSPDKISEIDELYRKRLQSMLAVDEMIGRLIGDLRATGRLDNTYIFFTSDNGLALGEHRRPSSKGVAYEEAIRVPLIVRGPGVPEGSVREHMVLNNDLAPTLADLAGISPPPFVDGRSLKPLLTDDPTSVAAWRSAFLVEGLAGGNSHHPSYKAVRTEDHLYVEYANDERELYDMRVDPYQLENQFSSADRELISQLEERLGKLSDCASEGCRDAEGF